MRACAASSAVGAHERDHVAVAALQVARQQLHADEAGGAGEQDVALRRDRHRSGASVLYAQTRRARVSCGAISSSTNPRAAATSGRSCVSA